MARRGNGNENLNQPKLFQLEAPALAGMKIKKQRTGFLANLFAPRESSQGPPQNPDPEFSQMNSSSLAEKEGREASIDHFKASKGKKVKQITRQEAERIANGRNPRISISKIENEQIPSFGEASQMVLTEAQILHDVVQMAVMDEKESSVLQSIDQMSYTLSRREKGEIKKAIVLARKAKNKDEYYLILAKNCPATIKYFREMQSDKHKSKIVKQMEKHGKYMVFTPQEIPEPNFGRIAAIVQPTINTLVFDDRIMKVPIFIEKKFLIWSRRSKRVLTITPDFWNIDGKTFDVKTSDPSRISDLSKKIQSYNRVRLSNAAASGGHILWDNKWGVEDDERTMVSVANAGLEDVTVSTGPHEVLIYAYDGQDNGKFAKVTYTDEEIIELGTGLYKAINKLKKKR